jgi:hypothetical protein
MNRVETTGNCVKVSGSLGLFDYKRILAALYQVSEVKEPLKNQIDCVQISA